jgi:hypothetical protein
MNPRGDGDRHWSHPPGFNRRPADYETTGRLKIEEIAFTGLRGDLKALSF